MFQLLDVETISNMKIRVVSICHNEARMMPFYLRHYSSFADEIEIFDDESDDGTAKIIANSSAKLRKCPFKGLHDGLMIDLFESEQKRAAEDGIDWLIVPDIDEILFAKQGVRDVLESAQDYDIVFAMGWNMMADSFPVDDGRQIWEICRYGCFVLPYCKPIICNPKANNFKWSPGRHIITGSPKFINSKIKLLHYRLLGTDHTDQTNLRNFQRRAIGYNSRFDGVPDGFPMSYKLLQENKHAAINAIEAEVEPI